MDVDLPPRNDEERAELRGLRPCGRSEMLILACRCHFCGLFFCRACAERHFASGGGS